VLLIDDNASNGWQATLEKVFACPVDTLTSHEEVLDFEKTKFSSYDLIFLDLYLPLKKGHNVKKNSEDSLSILKALKMELPQVPVIVFTASNKSWTLLEIMQMGADGMYVKESPDFIGEGDHSKQNFKSFVVIVKDTLKKYDILRPYWQHIQSILSDSNFITISDSPQKLQSRMAERLKMFYGLLKKGFEQWEYDKETFFYSDYELSFITLWSVLNEIQEAYFHKEQPNISIAHGTEIYTAHPDGSPLTYWDEPSHKQQKWTIGSSVFCDYEYTFKTDSITSLPKVRGRKYQLTSKRMSGFILTWNQFIMNSASQEIRHDYERDIRMQIAFILIKKF